jgi:WD40 repeat protein
MSSPEITFNNRYRAIYAVDERPGSRVLRCRDEQSGRLALVAELPAASDEERNGLRALATQIASIKHELLMPLTDHFAGERAYYLVCDDPGGQDLERSLRMRGAPFGEADTMPQIRRLLEGLEHLHAQRPPVVLGDLSSADVWVGEDGAWRLLPFVLVRAIGASPSPYRAPEIASSEAEPTPVSDIYAAGALVYHALTGWPPPTTQQIQAGTPLSSPRALNPNLSTLTEQGLLRALQPREANRYQTAREMRVALDTAQIMASKPATFAIDTTAQISSGPPPAAPETYVQPASGYPSTPPMPPAVPPAYGAPMPYPAPQKRGMSVGCIVTLAVVLTIALGAACIAAALIFTPIRSTLGLPSFGLPDMSASAATPEPTRVAEPTPATQETPADPLSLAPVIPTVEPIALGPDAITVTSAQAITQTREITTVQIGPVSYSPDGSLLALGVGDQVNLRGADALDEVTDFSGHKGQVTSLAWSADGSLLATGASGDNEIRVWNVEGRRLRHVLSGHAGWIRSLAFSPNGAILASGSTDLSVRIWDAQSGLLIRTLEGHTDLIGGVAFSPDGATLVSASRDGTVRLWDVASGQQKPGFAFETSIAQAGQRYWTTGVAFSPDGKTIAIGATDAVVYLLDATSGSEIRRFTGHTNWIVIRGIAFSPDGKRLYTTGLDTSIRVWDPETGSELATLDRHRQGVFSISMSADGRRLASSSDQEGTLFIWDLESDQPLNSLRVGQGVVTSTIFNPSSTIVGLVGFNGLMQVRLLEQDLTRPFTGSAGEFQPMAFVSDAEFAAITDQGTIVIVNVQTGETRDLEGFTGQPVSLAANREGKLIAAGGEGGTVVVWDATTGEVAARLTTDLPAVLMLSFSYGGDRLAIAGPPAQPEIEIWDLTSDQRSQVLSGPENRITSLSFQPGGTLVAATSLDGALRLWDAESGLPVRRTNADPSQGWFTSVAFSADGTLLATGAYNGSLQLWDVGSGEEAAQYRLPSSIFAVAFSPDGAMLTVSLGDGSVRFFTKS